MCVWLWAAGDWAGINADEIWLLGHKPFHSLLLNVFALLLLLVFFLQESCQYLLRSMGLWVSSTLRPVTALWGRSRGVAPQLHRCRTFWCSFISGCCPSVLLFLLHIRLLRQRGKHNLVFLSFVIDMDRRYWDVYWKQWFCVECQQSVVIKGQCVISALLICHRYSAWRFKLKTCSYRPTHTSTF